VKLGREMNTATILITHNLGIVAGVCDRVAVMYGGRIVEIAPRDPLFAEPRHPYTLGLLRCVPRVDRLSVGEFQSIPGQPPDLLKVLPGCSFAERCEYATEQCVAENPALTPGEGMHRAACFHQDRVERAVVA
jgi:oligopeptide/dipeptide ABC transporter ATP-binding protein